MLQVVALQPPIHSKGFQETHKLQKRAVSLVGRAASVAMRECANRILVEPPAGASDADGPDDLEFIDLVKSVSWQWDETTQRCSQILQERFANERLSKEKTAVQVMMQSGTVRSFECTSGKCAADEAIFCRATFLPTTSANRLLQGFFGNYPLDLEDEELLGRVSAQCVFLALPFSHDRAASSYKMLECVWNLLSRSSVPLNIAPHSEACTLHGFALVKNRPSFGRNLVKAGFSFTRLLRNWRDLDVWRRELMTIIKGRLVVRREPMPAESKALNKSIVEALFGTEDSAYLWVTSKNGERRKTQLFLDIEDLARHLELGKPVGDIIHWCWVEEGSEENIVLKQAPGSACCSSRDDSALKRLTVVLSYLAARAWVAGAESRWTDPTNTSKRMFLGLAGYELVPESLETCRRFGRPARAWKLSWQQSWRWSHKAGMRRGSYAC